MKFTNGYWCIRKEMTPLYAVEYADSKRNGDELIIYAPTKHVAHRGDCLNLGMLTVRLSSPMEDVIKVSIRHFEGTAYKGPFVEVRQANPHIEIRETDNAVIYQSGSTKAVINKSPDSWGIRFLDGNRELTNTGFRNMASITNNGLGKTYMVDALSIDVDEYIYGLGERFTPFVKNGQTVEMWNEDGGTSSEIAYKNIPLHVFHFDCYWMEAYEWCNFTWDSKTFPNPKDMLRRYHDKGLKICVWINPYIGQKSPLFREGMENGYLLKKENGDIWQTDMWQAGMGLVDFTNPAAVLWYQGKLKALLDMGVDCFKTDFGERIPVRGIGYYDGSNPVKMHNYYTFLYNKAVFELLVQERGEGEAVLFARSATAGGQQFPVHWGGDCSASYPSMAETLRSGLSLSCGGFGFWSHDMGGFENTATADIYKRWCQFGLLSTHSRLHGSSSYRVPWLFDEEACMVLEKFIKLKCSLMPYLYRQAAISHEKGIPVMRPMFMEFPGDRACETLDKQYMLGDLLLVAPIFKESGEVEYYVPEGKWYNILTDKTVEGGEWKKETYDYFHMPLLVRQNSILAMGNNHRRPDYEYAEGVTLYLILMEDGKMAYTEIPDLQGNSVMKVAARRDGNKIMVTVTGQIGKASCQALGMEGMDIIMKQQT